MRFSLASLVLLGALAAERPILAQDFAAFRGLNGWGVASEQSIPLAWSETDNLAWKVDLPGAGWSQPIVIGERLFVTAAVADEDLRPKNFADGVKTPQSMGVTLFAKAPDVEIDWRVICINTRDGSVAWEQSASKAKPAFPIHPSNSYATESPVADQNGVYAHFGACGTVVGMGLDGSLLWKRDVGAFKTSNSFGTGSSLAIFEGKIYLQNLTEGSADCMCLDSVTGETKWEMKRGSKSTSWSTPLVWQNQQRTEIIFSGNDQVDSFDPNTGDLLWSVSNVKAATACSPCADAQRLYFGGSDPFSKGALFAVSTGAQGDITPKKKNSQFEFCEWREDSAGPGMASPVSTGAYLYVVDKNILRCYESSTGKRLYQTRLPKLDMVASSPILIGSKLLIIDENGSSCCVATGPEFKLVGSGKLSDTFWATPAVANNSIYFRGVNSLYCIRSAAE
jgi:outer membrane protein assembly factor BamB